MTAKAFKPGDRVVVTDFGLKHGVIVNVAKASAEVKFDTDGETARSDRVALNKIREETASDVERRDHVRAMRAWRDRKPRHSVVSVPTTYSGTESGVAMYAARTPTDMRTAAEELLLLADWFETRPKDPA